MGSYTFAASVDNITSFPDYPALSKAGKFAQLPIVSGNSDFEAGVFMAVDELENQTYDRAYWKDFTNHTFAYPASARANVSASHGLPAWRCRWFGGFPNARLLPVMTAAPITGLRFHLFGTHSQPGQEFPQMLGKEFQ